MKNKNSSINRILYVNCLLEGEVLVNSCLFISLEAVLTLNEMKCDILLLDGELQSVHRLYVIVCNSQCFGISYIRYKLLFITNISNE